MRWLTDSGSTGGALAKRKGRSPEPNARWEHGAAACLPESLAASKPSWQAGKNLTVLKTPRHAVLVARPDSPQPRLSRRDRRKQETTDDIKATARRQLAGGGPAGISLRGIARDLGMTASAVHYYFPSRQALLDALIVDGFSSLAGALRSTYDQAGELPPDERCLAVYRAHRAWALQHPSEYLLLYGHTGGAAGSGHPQARQAMSEVVAVLFTMMRNAVANGDVDTERIEAATLAPLRGQLAAWRETTDGIGDLSDGALAACMISFAQLHGAITLELIGRVPPQLTDRSALFDLTMAHIAASLHRLHPA
jgi:AcrR family transcriptional regulator